MEDKSDPQFRQRKDGVSAIRKGPGGKDVETKMIAGPPEEKHSQNGKLADPETLRSLMDAATRVADAAGDAEDLSPEARQEIRRLVEAVFERVDDEIDTLESIRQDL